MSKVRTFLISDSPVCTADQMAEARRELAYQANYWGYGPLSSVAWERSESGNDARVENSDGSPVDVGGRWLLHFVGDTAT